MNNRLLEEINATLSRLGKEEAEIRRKRTELKSAATKARLAVNEHVILAELYAAHVFDIPVETIA